jgi:hypothetical protein
MVYLKGLDLGWQIREGPETGEQIKEMTAPKIERYYAED